MAVLLFASLAVMLFYARRELKEEALKKAAQTLESTNLHLDNILLSVEQTAGNFYFRIAADMHRKEMMHRYSRQVVEANRYVMGCAIAMQPGFYKEGEEFMAYAHRDVNATDTLIVRADTWGPGSYTGQKWYARPLATGKAGWLRPLDSATMNRLGTDDDSLAVLTFSLPIYAIGGQRVGVVGVDVALSLLSKVVLEAKPSEHSYSTLIGKDGDYIVHPDRERPYQWNVLTLEEKDVHETMAEAGKAMVSGETGYRRFVMDGKDYFVFYKPFKRAWVLGRTEDDIGWSAGVIYPEDDIFGDYNRLAYYVGFIAIGGLMLLFALCYMIIHGQLKALRRLTQKAQRIAASPGTTMTTDGGEDSGRSDEIGRLEDNFGRMQRALAAYMDELQRTTTTLEERGKVLRKAYNEAEKADRMKTAFLHNMTNQMAGPAEAIVRDVEKLHNAGLKQGGPQTEKLAESIEHNGSSIAELLNNLIKVSEEEGGKEETK